MTKCNIRVEFYHNFLCLQMLLFMFAHELDSVRFCVSVKIEDR